MCLPLRLTLTSPTSRNTRRCFETEGCSKPSLLTMSPTGRSPCARNSRISRRRGSATALNPSEVVDARAMHEIISVSYTHLRAHETPEHLVCRLLLEKKKKKKRHE